MFGHIAEVFGHCIQITGLCCTLKVFAATQPLMQMTAWFACSDGEFLLFNSESSMGEFV